MVAGPGLVPFFTLVTEKYPRGLRTALFPFPSLAFLSILPVKPNTVLLGPNTQAADGENHTIMCVRDSEACGFYEFLLCLFLSILLCATVSAISLFEK